MVTSILLLLLVALVAGLWALLAPLLCVPVDRWVGATAPAADGKAQGVGRG